MMKRMYRDAVLLSLIKEMKTKGSWCGETHIQKAAYFLQELLEVPMSLEFILYKHGPYSFDLSDEVTAMRADNLLEYKARRPYGPSLFPTREGQDFLDRYPKTLGKYAEKVHFIAENIGKMGVADLERLATALYVTLNENGEVKSRESRIAELKPHIKIDEAAEAVRKVDVMRRDAKEKGLSGGS
jgi:uncharacterized protein YwgA